MSAGDVIYGYIFHTPVVIINSVHAAHDLLEKRSAIYSDRPNMILHAEL